MSNRGIGKVVTWTQVADPATPANTYIALSSTWKKVATIDYSYAGFIVAPLASATVYDIEWITVNPGASAPTDAYGTAIQGGEDFQAGLPFGDVYLKSATSQPAVVKTGV